MRILVTSGGTAVPIDPVRSITNTSTGQFGSRLASAALEAGMQVTYLTSQQGAAPFAKTINFYNKDKDLDIVDEVKALYDFSQMYNQAYKEYRYHSFNEYAQCLQKIIAEEQPDIIMLAAAVSDYLITDYSTDKIRSKENLSLELKLADKIIHEVRTWAKNSFIIGFKLLIDADYAELANAALTLIKQHQLDLVIANNLSSIQRGAHEILLVQTDGSYQKIKQDIATTVIADIVKRCK